MTSVQRAPTGKSVEEALLLSSDDESGNDSLFDDDDDDDSLPPIEELFRQAAEKVGRSDIAAMDGLAGGHDGYRDRYQSKEIDGPEDELPLGLERRSVSEASSACSVSSQGVSELSPDDFKEHDSSTSTNTLPCSLGSISVQLGHSSAPQGNLECHDTLNDGPGQPTITPVVQDHSVISTTNSTSDSTTAHNRDALVALPMGQAESGSPSQNPQDQCDRPSHKARQTCTNSGISPSPSEELRHSPTPRFNAESQRQPSIMPSTLQTGASLVQSLSSCVSASESDNVRAGPPQCRRELRTRDTARRTNRQTSQSSSAVSDDESAGEDECRDDDDFQPQSQRRKQDAQPGHPSGPRNCSNKFASEKRATRLLNSRSPFSRAHQEEKNPTDMSGAVFEEWQLECAVLKRVTENGRTTLQIQFTIPTGARCDHTARSSEQPTDAARRGKRDTRSNNKEMEGNDVDDNRAEYRVAKILEHRFSTDNGQGLELLVEWERCGDRTWTPTWEPVEELQDTEAYDIYRGRNDVSKPFMKRKRGRPRKALVPDAVVAL